MSEPFYLKRSDGVYAMFEGMTEAQIIDMLTEQGLMGELVTEEEYAAHLRRP
jgi:hypothetical protein